MFENIENNKTINKQINNLPPKQTWQNFTVWTVTLIRSVLYCIYNGSEGGIIYINRKSLETVLTSIKNESNSTKMGKASFQFQENLEDFVRRTVNRQLPIENKIELKFARINYQTNNCVLYQKTYGLLPNSTNLGELLHTVAISLTLQELLSPLIHFSNVVLTAKTNLDDNGFENIDVD